MDSEERTESTRTPTAPRGHQNTLQVLEIVGILVVPFVVIVMLRLSSSAIPSKYMLHTFFAVIAVFAGYIVVRILTAVLRRAVEPHLGATDTDGIKNLIEVLGAVVVGVVISGILGFNLTTVLIGADLASA